MKKNILCFSRSYLSKLLPTLDVRDNVRNYFHVVLNTSEQKRVESIGGTVVLNIEVAVRDRLRRPASVDEQWIEPEDFRAVTKFNWSPLYSDRYLTNFSENSRVKIAGIVFSELASLFKKYNFDYFISEPVALYVTHVMYYFCEKNNTQSRFWANTFFPGHFFFCSGLDYSVPAVRNIPASCSKEQLVSIKEFCEGVMEDKAGPVYHFSFSTDTKKKMTYFDQRTGGAALILSPNISTVILQALRVGRAIVHKIGFPYVGDFQSAGSLQEHLFYFKCLLTRKGYYDQMPDSQNNSLVYSLQYEPEASLLYAGPDFYNQYILVEMILRALPDGKLLYVKEHPNQFGALGVGAWKSLRRKYHNLRYIYGRESGRDLIKRSSGLISVSSSAGMDAVLLGKPVLLAGRAFYMNFPNVTPLKKYSELPLSLKSLDVTVSSKDQLLEEVTGELKHIFLNSYKGDPQPSATLYSDENLNALVAGIDQACG